MDRELEQRGDAGQTAGGASPCTGQPFSLVDGQPSFPVRGIGLTFGKNIAKRKIPTADKNSLQPLSLFRLMPHGVTIDIKDNPQIRDHAGMQEPGTVEFAASDSAFAPHFFLAGDLRRIYHTPDLRMVTVHGVGECRPPYVPGLQGHALTFLRSFLKSHQVRRISRKELQLSSPVFMSVMPAIDCHPMRSPAPSSPGRHG